MPFPNAIKSSSTVFARSHDGVGYTPPPSHPFTLVFFQSFGPPGSGQFLRESGAADATAAGDVRL